jgi:PKD repeat protein
MPADDDISRLEVAVQDAPAVDPNGDAPATQTSTITVNDVPPTIDPIPNQTVNEGDPVSLAPVTFHDQGTEDTLQATIDWGDGSTTDTGTVTENTGPTGTTVPNDGRIQFPDHVYADEGTYTVTVTLEDTDPASDAPVTQTFAITVNDVPPTIDPILDQTVNQGGAANAGTVTFHDQGTADQHRATIDWGDNSAVDNGTVTEHTGPSGAPVPNDGSVTFPSHTYAKVGKYTVTVTLKDTDGDDAPVSTKFTVTVLHVTGPSQPTLRRSRRSGGR